jgi:hypothetical protein
MRTLPAGYNAGDTIYCYFESYDSDGASVTITGLAVTDIEVYKDGGTTQRASDNGYALLDTDGIDFDGATGLHGFSLDTSDNSDSGFWTDGSHYLILVDAVTIDSQTVRLGFDVRLGVVSRPATAGRKIAVDASGRVDVGAIEGSDPTDQIRDAVVDDATRIDASALNTLSSHDPGETLGTADPGDQMDLVNSPNATAIDAIRGELPAIATATATGGSNGVFQIVPASGLFLTADAFNGLLCKVVDVSTGQHAWRWVTDHSASTNANIFFDALPFSVEAGDTIAVYPTHRDVNLTLWRGTQPLTLDSSRVRATAVSVSDKTGYSISGTKTTLDALNDLAAQDVRDAMKLAPTAGAPAAGSLDGHLDDTQAVTDKLDTALEQDGAVYRFTQNALELSPAGGGGSTVVVTPVMGVVTPDTTDTEIRCKVGATNPKTIAAFDANGDPVDLTAFGDLRLCIETLKKVDVQVVEQVSLTISGDDNEQVTFTPSADTVASARTLRWSLRRAADNYVILSGPLVVEYEALADA